MAHNENELYPPMPAKRDFYIAAYEAFHDGDMSSFMRRMDATDFSIVTEPTDVVTDDENL